jgi:hypothetical protein
MRRNDAVELAVSAVCLYAKKGRPAIAVDYLNALTGDLWEHSPGFHEDVKAKAYAKHGVEMIYVYERPENPHFAVSPIPEEIRQRARWQRYGDWRVEADRWRERQPDPHDDRLDFAIDVLGGVRKLVGFPDPDREGDPVLEYIDTVTA